MTDPRPIITIDPGVRFGAPTIRGIPTGSLAELVYAGDGVAPTAQDFGLTVDEVLLACWWEAESAKTSRFKRDRVLVARWGAWADTYAFPYLALSRLGTVTCPHPPKGATA